MGGLEPRRREVVYVCVYVYEAEQREERTTR